MKKLSETLSELNINFSFPIKIKDADANTTYYEHSNGTKRGTPRSVKACEGKIVEFDGVKYELKAL